jgi:hypothetical protein
MLPKLRKSRQYWKQPYRNLTIKKISIPESSNNKRIGGTDDCAFKVVICEEIEPENAIKERKNDK